MSNPYTLGSPNQLSYSEKLSRLRTKISEQQLAAYIIPHSDPHQSEYLADHWEIIRWLSGFDGSAGTVVVTKDFAGLWTDSRYFIQAENQLKGKEIEMRKLINPAKPEYIEWLIQHILSGEKIGVNGQLLSSFKESSLRKKLSEHELILDIHQELISEIWLDRPAVPSLPVFEHKVKYTGKSRVEKIDQLVAHMKESQVNYLLLSALDDIAWTFNLRGEDIAYNPVFFAFALVGLNGTTLFIDELKLPESLQHQLKIEGITIKPYDTIKDSLESLSKEEAVWLSPTHTNSLLYKTIPSDCIAIKRNTPATLLKSQKIPHEVHNLKEVMIQDGIAMVKFLYWVKNEIQSRTVSEVEAVEKLLNFRQERPNFQTSSFATIAGYNANGAIVHYKASADSHAILANEGIFLLDSGGHYLGGTTDITRTISFGIPDKEVKQDFTKVLKGNIQLSMAIFPEGTKGYQLDILARKSLWESGLNYGHGTGHGVGYFLNVHEGPQSIRPLGSPNASPLIPGMILSNEPGIYRENQYGIRIENLVLVVPKLETEFGQFFGFETLTLCPIEIDLIDPSILAKEEKDWLNQYHSSVYSQLSSHLLSAEKDWLANQTQPI